ncbi:hypothetical protein GG804_08215 [Sphingomonas histidinilytica]|uniref:hypothetical protein n=1 Tax=Rhizorhabdus histidinilytica TaxID=439228 RepID=UPI001ADAF7AD|nr:hypothetical protein [Rhizorhabdus histidinilytica]MBO9376748.1 hypothetical protein [Rhizorhabdus histidinilytica]
MHRRPGLLFSVAFGLAALVIAARGDASLPSHLLIAAAAGALIGLGSRLWMVSFGLAMLAWAATHLAASGPALWLASLSLILAAVPRSLAISRPPIQALAALPLLIAIGLLPTAQGLTGWAALLLALACVAATLYGACLIAAVIVEGGGPATLPIRSDRVGAIARHFLLGRIAPGLSHDLGQSLNVIIMANSNIAYIVDQLDLSAEERSQLTARIARIGTHSDMAAGMLGLLRWFGRDDARDKGPMTVGSALERAIAAVRPQARAARMAIELRGDALDFPAAARQGAIEMIGVAPSSTCWRRPARRMAARPPDASSSTPRTTAARWRSACSANGCRPRRCGARPSIRSPSTWPATSPASAAARSVRSVAATIRSRW